MGLTSLFLILCGVFCTIGILWKDNPRESIQGLAITSFVIGLFSGIAGVSMSACLAIDFFQRDRNEFKTLQHRAVLQRMMIENYNSVNLTNALDFNNEQNLIRRDNESFWMRFLKSYYYVDTIEIPQYQFTPTQNLNVRLEGVSE